MPEKRPVHMTIFHQKLWRWGPKIWRGEGPAVLLKRSLAGKILEGISGYQKNGRFQVHLEASQI